MRSTKGSWAVLALLGGSALVSARIGRFDDGGARMEMGQAARAWLATLGPELAQRARFAYDAKERTDWRFVPGERAGVSFKEMNDTQRRAGHALLRSGMSASGYLKTTSIMQLDMVLRDLERARGGDGASRDPERYVLAVFGEPGGATPWGWKVEGHHVSLNFSSVDEELTATTPSFLGANPAEVRDGPRAGLRVLSAEEDLGRRLARSLSPEQRRVAVSAEAAPRDVLLGPGTSAAGVEARGVAYSDLTPDQRELVEALIGTYAGNLRGDLRAWQLARLRAAGIEKVRFSWAGRLESGQGHYYRLQGPTFIIEYDNTQDGANHVHTVWRDPVHDFGSGRDDPLRRHLGEDHGVRPIE
ncbi:MAG: DUF3500 domain-containing protein [Phycisphaerae bacterium]|nr:DUF3500 domain-containing protein [Phycisphaerae bacterium]